MSSVCSVSIVKNEEHIILRMLNNLSKYVDEFIIVDTGSTDNTIEIIKNFYKEKNIPGRVFQRKWKNFGYNKTQALQLAEKFSKCDYLLFMDADNTIEGKFKLPPKLDADAYMLKQGHDFEKHFWRTQMFKKGLGWEYVGVLHEYPHSSNSKKVDRIEGSYFCKETHEGARNKNYWAKYERDVFILLEGLKDEPNNSRYMYYLGQSYKCLYQNKLAAKWYLRCSEKTNWDEEKYHSLYSAGKCYLYDGDIEKAKKYLIQAYVYRPTRIESIYTLMRHFWDKKEYEEAYVYGKLIENVPLNTNDVLFVEQDIHTWKYNDDMSIVCYNLGLTEEGKNHILRIKQYPFNQEERIKNNLKYFL